MRGYLLGCLLVLQTSLFPAHIQKDISLFGFKKISDSPEIYECDNFLSDDECAYIINEARPRLQRSTMVSTLTPQAR